MIFLIINIYETEDSSVSTVFCIIWMKNYNIVDAINTPEEGFEFRFCFNQVYGLINVWKTTAFQEVRRLQLLFAKHCVT